LEQLRAAALETGHAFGLTAIQVAQAEEELAKAGVSVAEILGGALSGSLALAAAGELSVAEAATIAVQAMNAFNLSGSDVGRIAGVLASGANKSATDVHNLGQGLSQVAVNANRMKLSLEDTIGTLALFAQKGIVGSDAGTSLKLMLSRLAPTTKEAGEQYRKYFGTDSPFYEDGQFIGLTASFKKLHDVLGDLATTDMDAVGRFLQDVAGTDAGRGFAIAITGDPEDLRNMIDSVSDYGAALDVAAKRLDNLSGDYKKLKSTLSSSLIEGGSGAQSGLRGLVQGVDGAIQAFGKMPASVQHGIVSISGVVGAALVLDGALGLLKPKLAAMALGLEKVGVSAGFAAKSVGFFSKALGVVGTIAIVAVGMKYLGDKIAGIGDAKVDVERTNEAVVNLGRAAEIAKRPVAELATAIASVKAAPGDLSDFEQFAQKIVGLMGRFKISGAEAFDQMDKSLAGLVQGGNREAAKASFDAIIGILGRLGIDAKTAASYFDDYGRAERGAASAADLAAAAAERDAKAKKDETLATLLATGAAIGLNEGTDDLRDSFFNLVDAQRAYAAGGRAVTAALEARSDAQHELDEFVKKGRVDQEALTDATERYEDALDGVTDAEEEVTEAGEALAEALKPASFDDITEAADRVTTSLLSLKDANKALEQSIADLDAMQLAHDTGGLFGVDPEDIEDAQSDVDAAWKKYVNVFNDDKASTSDVADAKKEWIDAQDELNDLLEEGRVTDEELADAHDDVTLATIGVHDATDDLHDAQTDVNTVMRRGTELDPKVIQGRKDLDSATEGLADATRDAGKAHDELITVQAGDPEWDEKLRDHKQKVADATWNVRDAQYAMLGLAVDVQEAVAGVTTKFREQGDQAGYVLTQLEALKTKYPELKTIIDGMIIEYKMTIKQVDPDILAGAPPVKVPAVLDVQGILMPNPTGTAAPQTLGGALVEDVFGKGASAGDFIFMPMPHAEGGITSAPHVGLVGEAGPEAIIPLDVLWQRMASFNQDWLDSLADYRPDDLRPTDQQVTVSLSSDEFRFPIALPSVHNSDDRLGRLESLLESLFAVLGSGDGDGGDIYVTVNVNGSVTTSRDLAEMVRSELLKTGRRNSGTGLR
jgi:TP901 family phage tail tape measure protein